MLQQDFILSINCLMLQGILTLRDNLLSYRSGEESWRLNRGECCSKNLFSAWSSRRLESTPQSKSIVFTQTHAKSHGFTSRKHEVTWGWHIFIVLNICATTTWYFADAWYLAILYLRTGSRGLKPSIWLYSVANHVVKKLSKIMVSTLVRKTVKN